MDSGLTDAAIAGGESRERLTGFERTVAFCSVLGIVFVWTTAFLLNPDARGHGTHEQLGLSPCRMVVLFGIPCAFCGMTTAFAHLADGELWRAFVTQPAAVVIAFGTFPAAFAAFGAGVTGRAPAWAVSVSRSWRVFAVACTILVVAWIYKIATFG